MVVRAPWPSFRGRQTADCVKYCPYCQGSVDEAAQEKPHQTYFDFDEEAEDFAWLAEVYVPGSSTTTSTGGSAS